MTIVFNGVLADVKMDSWSNTMILFARLSAARTLVRKERKCYEPKQSYLASTHYQRVIFRFDALCDSYASSLIKTPFWISNIDKPN